MKKRTKALLAWAAVLTMGVSVLASCGNKTASGDSSAAGENKAEGKTALSLAIWDEKQRPMMESLVEAYEKEHPDVTVEVQLTPYKGGEYWTKLEAAATGGKAPDVFWLNVLHTDSYVDKEIFDKAGVSYPTNDMTYEDLVAKAEELKKAGLPDGVYPFACPVDFQTWYYQTVFANGGWILSEDKKTSGYDDPKTQGGIQCWIDMIDKGLSPSSAALSETSSDAMFEGGQLAMNFAGSYMVPEYAGNDTIKDKIDCVELPSFNGIETNCINGLGYAVYEGSKNKEAATDLAIWLSSKEAMDIQGNAGVVISARNESQELFAKSSDKYDLSVYTAHTDKAYPLPVCKNAAELYDMESKALQKAYSGEESLSDACKALKVEADAFLAKNQ